MKKRTERLLAALAASAFAVFQPTAADGADLATSAPLGGIRVDTSGRALILNTSADVTAFASRPVTFRKGETVTAMAPDGTVTTLASAAPDAGTTPFSPNAGGLWRLENSNGATALVGVAWTVFGENWSRTFGPVSPIVADTNGEGPDRYVRKPGPFPAIAYSGDNWLGGAAAESTLTLVSPSGSSTSFNLSGTGARAFDPPEAGDWIVTLVSGNGTMSGTVTVVAAATTIIMR